MTKFHQMNNRVLTIFYFLLLNALPFFMGCQPTTTQTGNQNEERFEPRGDLSDLVYNPMRQDGSIDSSFLPIVIWDQVEFDFGVINEGDAVRKDFTFTNTGTAPLLILNATSTCGCTIPEWPEKQIPPGGTGSILVIFDSTNKEGSQNKQVTIFANTFPNKSIITIKGRVEKTQ